MIEWIDKIFVRIKERRKEFHQRCVKERANELFQVKEQDGLLWLTYDGNLVMPFCFMCDDRQASCIEKLTAIREQYIDRNIK